MLWVRGYGLPLPHNNKPQVMEQKEISIHEALPILKEVLNMSGIAKLMGKSTSWFYDKSNERVAPFSLKSQGFTDEDLKLINNSLSRIADKCESHLIKPLAEGVDRKEHHVYAVSQLKEIRKLISFVYLREKHTTISEQSLSRKLRSAPNKGSICMFTESDISQINEGLKAVAQQLRSIKITL